jgi:hypothetical protein
MRVTMAGFSAEAALYRTSRRYNSAGPARPRSDLLGIRPQLRRSPVPRFSIGVGRRSADVGVNYSCDSVTNMCTCKGVIDCDDMRGRGECEGWIACGNEGCTCVWHKE